MEPVIILLVGLLVLAAFGVSSFMQERRRRKSLILRHGAEVQQRADGRISSDATLQGDSAFDAKTLAERTAVFYETYAACLRKNDLSELADILTPGFRAAARLDMDNWTQLQRRVEIYDLDFQETFVADSFSDGLYDIVFVRLRGACMSRILHTSTNRLVGSDAESDTFDKVVGLVRRRGTPSIPEEKDGTLDVVCPHCGADLQELAASTPHESGTCPACHARIDDGAADWAVWQVGEAGGWRNSDQLPPEPVGNMSYIRFLDRADELFYRYHDDRLYADAGRLADCATPQFIADHATDFKAMRDGRHSLFAYLGVGRYEWNEVSPTRAVLRIHWRGRPVQARVPSFLQVDLTLVRPDVHQIVLERENPDDDSPQAWRLAGLTRVNDDIVCSDALPGAEGDGIDEAVATGAAAATPTRIPSISDWERDILFQNIAYLLQHDGVLPVRMARAFLYAAVSAGIEAERARQLIEQVMDEGPALCSDGIPALPPAMLLRHLARLVYFCGEVTPAANTVLVALARRYDLDAKSAKTVLAEEARILNNVILLIRKASA